MKSKSGFTKAACKRLAVELRQEASLGPMDPFDPWLLANMYGILVVPISALDITVEVRHHFTVSSPNVFSGALIPLAHGAAIVENDTHARVRRRSTMGHELAHVFAEHQFDTSLVNERGCRSANSTQEDEANELAGELLIPFEAAKALARQEATNEEVASQFDVSVRLAQWRMDGTGARLIARRRAAASRRASPEVSDTQT